MEADPKVRARQQRRNRRANDTPLLNSVSISMVKNEQDIIEPFIRHNIQFFDLMFVLDNGSNDRTREILLECAREFDNLCVADIPHVRYAQSQFMTSAMRFVQAGCFADFIAFLDADEFIEASDRAAFTSVLKDIPVGGYGTMGWKTILPDPTFDTDEEVDCLERAKWQRRAEKPQYVKGIFRPGGRIWNDVVVDQGNHGFRDVNGKALPSIALRDLALLHYPVRSSTQTLAKGVIGWRANLAMGKAPSHAAYQWRRINELYEAGTTKLSAQMLADEAMVYAQKRTPRQWHDNAVPWHGKLPRLRKFSDGRSAPMLALLEPAPAAAILSYRPNGKRGRVSTNPVPYKSGQASSAQDDIFLDIPPFRFLVEKHQVQSCLDIACGSGALLDSLDTLGMRTVHGADHHGVSETLLSDSEYTSAQSVTPFDLGRTYDLVIGLELSDAANETEVRTIFENVNKHASGLIVFSMPEPGQPGRQPRDGWAIGDVLELWAALGWSPSVLDTLAARALSTLSWLRRNLVVLKRTSEGANRSDTELLRHIGELGYVWYGQHLGIRHAPFDDAPIPMDRGYL